MPWLKRWLVFVSVAVLATAVAACQKCDSCCPECPQAASVTPEPCPPTPTPPEPPGPDKRPAPDISGYVCHDADGDNLCTAADGTSENPPAAQSGAVLMVTLSGTQAGGGTVNDSITPRAADGYFDFINLEPGSYTLEVTGVAATLSPAWERDGSPDGTVSNIVLTGTAGSRASPPFQRDLDFVYQ